jgi:geranylgeranyl diphosphate synthase, type I
MLVAPQRRVELLPALSAYGLPLGDAFQMRDDVMGAFGETAITGKPVGDDLREGKPTPLMAIAMERASATQREVLTLVGRETLSDRQVADAQQAIIDCGALDEMEAVIVRLRDEAIASLRVAPIVASATTELELLAAYVTDRTT